MTRREAGYQYMHTLIFIVPRRLTNVAADKHFWIARFARIVRCACS